MGDKPRSRLASSDRRERVLRFVRHYFAGTPAEPARMPPSIFISVPVKYPDSSEDRLLPRVNRNALAVYLE